jgi:hypothetical protein
MYKYVNKLFEYIMAQEKVGLSPPPIIPPNKIIILLDSKKITNIFKN